MASRKRSQWRRGARQGRMTWTVAPSGRRRRLQRMDSTSRSAEQPVAYFADRTIGEAVAQHRRLPHAAQAESASDVRPRELELRKLALCVREGCSRWRAGRRHKLRDSATSWSHSRIRAGSAILRARRHERGAGQFFHAACARSHDSEKPANGDGQPTSHGADGTRRRCMGREAQAGSVVEERGRARGDWLLVLL